MPEAPRSRPRHHTKAGRSLCEAPSTKISLYRSEGMVGSIFRGTIHPTGHESLQRQAQELEGVPHSAGGSLLPHPGKKRKGHRTAC